MRSLTAATAALCVVGATVMVASTSHASDAVTLTVSPDRVQIVPATNSDVSAAPLMVRVNGPRSVRVDVSLSDVVADNAGNWLKAPLGSTSYSLAKELRISPTSIAVQPAEKPQEVPISLSLPTSAMDVPRVGIVVVTLTPEIDPSSDGTSINQGLEIDTVVVAEADPSMITDANNVRVSLAGTGLTVDPTNEFTLIDSSIPDFIPGLVDHGPVTTFAHYQNNGDFIVDAQTTFTFANVGPTAMFGSDDPGEVFYELNDANHYALPGQPAAAEGSSIVEANGASIDSLPFIGFVKVTATTTGALGPLAAAPVMQSAVFLVFPWKEALVLILVVVLWVLFRRWRRNRRDRRTEPPASPEVREPVESVT